jgi:Ran-binding protein 1
VFGAASSGGGFAGFTGAGFGTAAPAAAAAAASDEAGAATAAGAYAGGEGDDDGAAAAEEECQAEYKPVVQLEEVETSTGEEDEEAMVEL